MSIDPRYVLSPNQQNIFRDKTTGLPLRNGYVRFSIDTQRTLRKVAYMISGTPPDYTYTPLPTTVQLTGIGSMSDSAGLGGNDIKEYYFPFDANGNTELYYIEVFDENMVPQWQREGWPNTGEGSGGITGDFINFIPNGQFLAHNDIPATDTTVAGQITAASTTIAQGGWTFERPMGSTAKDIVLFIRNGSDLLSPNASPRFSLNVQCQMIGSDAFKDIQIKFPDVNKFGDEVQKYTIAFAARSNNGNSQNVALYLIKNFGTGGDSPTQLNLAQFTITPTEAVYQDSFIFGTNISKTIGSLDDDYVALSIRFPNALYSVIFDNFVLTINGITFTLTDLFPPTTNADFFARGVAGWMPTPAADGSDLYLPLRLTQSGVFFDTSEVGQIVFDAVNSTVPANINLLACDGAKYRYSAYSALGIPYSRLGNKIFNNTVGVPMYGTGADFATTFIVGGVNFLSLHNNTAGTVTTPTQDGGVPTGFNFTILQPGATTYKAKTFWANTYFILENQDVGAVTAPTAGTSTFTLSTYRTGTASLRQITLITPIAAATLASTYFTYQVPTQTPPAFFYVWFKVDGTGTDPAPTNGVPILVNLTGTDTAANVAQRITAALNGGEVSLIKTTAGSTVPAGSYWIFDTTGATFFVWYTVNGIGTMPSVAGRIAIEVDILSTDTNAQVATKTMVVINKKYFATPDSRGLFPRIYDANATIDTNFRYSNVDGIFSPSLGTLQFDENLSHTHVPHYTPTGYDVVNGGQDVQLQMDSGIVGFPTDQVLELNLTNDYEGINQSQPLNISFNVFIRY